MLPVGKSMLEKRIYTRQELIEIYKTQRLDAIKNKVKREGYSYIDSGRGASYTMQIVDIPKGQAFKEYCINVLKFAPQTDFNILRCYLHNFIYNDGFITLQYNEMKEVLNKQGIDVCEKTIASYYEHLKGIGWAYKTPFEYIYYVYDTEQQHNRYISQEEFREMYKGFYKQVRKDGGKFYNAEKIIREKYGGKPKKRPLLQKNGFYNEQYNAVQELLEKEFSTI